MSAFNVYFLFILTLGCRGLAGEGLKWVKSGGSVVIHCTAPKSGLHSFMLKRGLLKEEQVVYLMQNYTPTVQAGFKHRLQPHGDLKEQHITIKNLTVEDTSAYWCMYTEIDKEKSDLKEIEGIGSLLLVVNGKCNGENHGISMNVVLVCALTAGSVLLLTLIILFLWIIPKVKAWRASTEPKSPKTNDVYEEMRATLKH